MDAAHRILAVNLLTLVLLALGVLYLDAFRNQLSKERMRQIRREADIAAPARWQPRPAAAREPVARVAGPLDRQPDPPLRRRRRAASATAGE